MIERLIATGSSYRYLLALTALVAATPTAATKASEFYRGKSISLVIPSGPGGGYDSYSRLLANHMPRHLTGNPPIVLQFMPGAGGVKAANYLYSVAPKNGLVFGLMTQSIAQTQLLQGGVKYDATKFNWLGRTSSQNSLLVVSAASGIRTLDDARHKPLLLGATGKGSYMYLDAILLKTVLGFERVKVIPGYGAAAAVDLAVERGEVHGRVAAVLLLNTRAADFAQKKLIPLLVFGLDTGPDLRHIPLVGDIARTPEDKKVVQLIVSSAAVGRSYAAPPDVPAARVDELRKAFDLTMRDEPFKTEAAKRGVDLDPLPAAGITKIIHDAVSQPPALIERARAAIK